MLKKSIDCLGSTLSQCAMDHKKLESIFRKKYAPHVYTHHTRHAHASHAHTHDSMYAHVYTCIHCGRTDYIARFCYDRIHNSNFCK